MNYNWSKYNIQDRLEQLERLTKKETDKKELRKIYYSIEITKTILEEFEDIHYEEQTILENLKQDAEYFTLYKFLKNDIINFSLDDEYLDTADKKYKPLTLAKKDILQITHDFYKSFDKEIYKNFMEVYNRRSDHLRFINFEESLCDNVTYIIPYFKESFIQLHKADTIESIFSAIHEYGLATSHNINEYHMCDGGKHFISEVDSIFLELVAADYLNKHYDFKDEYLSIAADHDGYLYSSKIIADKIKLAMLYKEYNFKNNKTLKKVANSKLNFSSILVEDIVESDPYFETPYISSFLFAVELYELYKFDPEKALSKYKSYISLNSHTAEEYYREMNKLGFYPNSHMKDFREDIKYKLSLNK